MGDRDEKGRLKLPDANLVPFQRVLSRSNRGSKNSSRHESPEYSPRRNRSNRQWPSSESKRSTRSHSYNMSEYRNSQGDNQNGYYFDGDRENDEYKPRRRRSKLYDNSSDMTKNLKDLSLRNGRQPRSQSLTTNSENKMPYIPFQRVLNIRRRPTVVEPERTFRVPAYTGLRDRGEFRFRTDKSYRSDGYTSEYKSRYIQRQRKSRARKKLSKMKNDSHLTEILDEKVNLDPETELDEKDINDDTSENGDHERSSLSRLSRGSKHSGGSNGYDEGNASGYEDRAESSSPSIKLPQIQPSPTMSVESAKSISGTGAVPTSKQLTISTHGSNSASENTLLLNGKLQAIDTSRWVEGKGAGRLNHYFKVTTPKHKSNESIMDHETENITEDTRQRKENRGDMNKITNQFPTVPSKKTYSPTEHQDIQKIAKNKNNHIRIPHKRNNLPRSKSDSALIPYKKKENFDSQRHTQTLKSNEVIIFKDKAASKNTQIGSRPHTSLPRIVLTMPEEQNSPEQAKFLEKQITKNIEKGVGLSLKTDIPSLPNISITKDDNENNLSSKEHQSIRPKSSQPKRKQKYVRSSKKKSSHNLKTSLRTKKKTVFAKLHRPNKAKSSHKVTKMKSNKSKITNSTNHNHNFLHVTNQPLKSASSKEKINQEMKYTSEKFSIDNTTPQAHPYNSNKHLAVTLDQAKVIELTGSYNQDKIKQHIGNIRQQRTKRLQKFSHFLRQKDNTDEMKLLENTPASQL